MKPHRPVVIALRIMRTNTIHRTKYKKSFRSTQILVDTGEVTKLYDTEMK